MEMGACDLSVIFKKEIQKYGCVKEPKRVFYWQKMLEAVQAIHLLGVIHSDLKPANFLVVNDEIKLILIAKQKLKRRTNNVGFLGLRRAWGSWGIRFSWGAPA